MTRQRIGRCGWATTSQQRGQQIAMRSTAASVGGPNAPIPLVAPLDAHAYFSLCVWSSALVSFTCLMVGLVIVGFFVALLPSYSRCGCSLCWVDCSCKWKPLGERKWIAPDRKESLSASVRGTIPKITKTTYAQTGNEYTPV